MATSSVTSRRPRALRRPDGAGTARGLPALPLTKAARQARILALLAHQGVRSQGELARLLAADGVEVTQATLSRDLDELGARKVRIGDGLTYAVPADGAPRLVPDTAGTSRLARLLGELLTSVEANGDLVVVRTPPGGAHLVASALDRADLAELMGTVAGDDTVLLICRRAANGVRLARQAPGSILAAHLRALAECARGSARPTAAKR